MKVLLLVCFLMSSTFAFGKGGDEVLNGGGIAEGYLHFAMENLGKHIDVCLSQTECAKKNNGREILKLIRDSLKDENAKDILEFSNNAKKPGFFVIDGYVRMAVTGSHVGDTIWYNLDLLYNNGQVRIDYGQAVQSLIHELGHHHGIIDHDQLELVGAEVRSAVTGSVSESTYMPHLGSQGFSAIGTEARSFENSGSLLLLFKDKMVDLTPQFSSLLTHCDPDDTSASPLKSKALQFFNLHWQYTNQSQAAGEKVLTGQVLLYCEHQYLKRYRRFYNFSMGVKVGIGTYFEYLGSRLLAKPEFLFKMVNPII